MEQLSYLDMMFCVDLTSSMTPFIQAARQHMVNILRALAATNQADLRFGISGYRDYSEEGPPCEVYPLSSDLEKTQGILNRLQARSPADNKDAAEAVFAGIVQCLNQSWRPGAYRIVLLVGDAPPHGCGADAQPFPDRWPEGDPTGLDIQSICGRTESARVTLFALSMSPSVIPVHDPVMIKAFDRLARGTGGTHRRARSGRDAMKIVEDITKKVFYHLDIDRRVYEQFFQEQPEVAQKIMAASPIAQPAAARTPLSREDLEKLAQSLDLPPDAVSTSITRLQKRGLQQPPSESAD